jgi:hypothetical protein
MSNPYKIAEAFAADFRQIEYALKRSLYLRKGSKVAKADWDRFANSLGSEFFEHIVSTGLAKTLIGHPPRELLADMQWSPPNPAPLTNVTQLMVNGVCRVRNSYIHGEKFTGGPEGQWQRDATLVAEAHAVLKEAMQFANAPPPILSDTETGEGQVEKGTAGAVTK